MSHDIRTPLNGIIGLLKIDETHFDDPTLVRENHKKMAVAADHLLSLINDVL
jgi:signal transduction histidine kinase